MNKSDTTVLLPIFVTQAFLAVLTALEKISTAAIITSTIVLGLVVLALLFKNLYIKVREEEKLNVFENRLAEIEEEQKRILERLTGMSVAKGFR